MLKSFEAIDCLPYAVGKQLSIPLINLGEMKVEMIMMMGVEIKLINIK